MCSPCFSGVNSGDGQAGPTEKKNKTKEDRRPAGSTNTAQRLTKMEVDTHTHTHTHTHKNVTDAGIDAAVAVSDVVDFQQALFGEIGPVGGGVQDAVVLHPGDPRPTKSRTVQSRKRERERERERASSE